MALKKEAKSLGLLSPKSSDKFLDMVIQNTPILQMVTCPKVDSPSGSYPVVSMAQYKTRGFTNAHNNAGGRKTVATLQELSGADLSYNLKELVLAIVVQDSYVEDSDTTPEKVAEMIAKMFAKDLSQLLINGDTELIPEDVDDLTDREEMLLILDGLVKQMEEAGKTVTYGDTETTISKKLAKLISGSPDDFVADPDSKILISPSDMTLLWDEVTNTKAIIKERDGKLYYRGKHELVEIAGLPQNRMIFGNAMGILAPLGREVQMETQRYPEARGFKAVLTTRVDFNMHPQINARMLIEEPVDPPAGGGQ